MEPSERLDDSTSRVLSVGVAYVEVREASVPALGPRVSVLGTENVGRASDVAAEVALLIDMPVVSDGWLVDTIGAEAVEEIEDAEADPIVAELSVELVLLLASADDVMLLPGLLVVVASVLVEMGEPGIVVEVDSVPVTVDAGNVMEAAIADNDADGIGPLVAAATDVAAFDADVDVGGDEVSAKGSDEVAVTAALVLATSGIVDMNVDLSGLVVVVSAPTVVVVSPLALLVPTALEGEADP